MIEASGPPVQPALPSLPFLILAFSGSAPIPLQLFLPLPLPPLGSYLPYNVPGSASFSPRSLPTLLDHQGLLFSHSFTECSFLLEAFPGNLKPQPPALAVLTPSLLYSLFLSIYCSQFIRTLLMNFLWCPLSMRTGTVLLAAVFQHQEERQRVVGARFILVE